MGLTLFPPLELMRDHPEIVGVDSEVPQVVKLIHEYNPTLHLLFNQILNCYEVWEYNERLPKPHMAVRWTWPDGTRRPLDSGIVEHLRMHNWQERDITWEQMDAAREKLAASTEREFDNVIAEQAKDLMRTYEMIRPDLFHRPIVPMQLTRKQMKKSPLK